jgi:hypothetical protein
MTNRREFLVTTIAAAALPANRSGQALATLSGLSIADETGRDTAFNDSNPGGHDMTDKAEDPRIRRARLSGPEHVTKRCDGRRNGCRRHSDRSGQRNERVGLYTGKRKQNRRPTDVHESHGYAMDDGCQARKAEADEHSARNDLHAVRCNAEKQHPSWG